MISDPTEEKLAGLEPATGLRAYWLVRLAREAGIPLMIISGRRSPELNAQVGGATHSWHLVGKAFDVQVLGYSTNELSLDWWKALGGFAENALGLRWGGRFNDVNHFDLGG